jgi:hypothetical protein
MLRVCHVTHTERSIMKLMSMRWACLLLLALSVGATSSIVSAEQGRWKVDADGNCVFDANDDGPDQCLPANPPGRWKVGSDGACYFEQNDIGPNQCEPPVTESAMASPADLPVVSTAAGQ